jgi:hypothetical protein
MTDDKRFLRKLKRDIKRSGNKKRRRYLKDPSAPPDEFDFGRDRTDVMNEPRRERERRDDAAEEHVESD